jgi:hypothetical protein
MNNPGLRNLFKSRLVLGLIPRMMTLLWFPVRPENFIIILALIYGAAASGKPELWICGSCF